MRAQSVFIEVEAGRKTAFSIDNDRPDTADGNEKIESGLGLATNTIDWRQLDQVVVHEELDIRPASRNSA